MIYIQTSCKECYNNINLVGKIEKNKCWYCRFPTFINKLTAINVKRIHVKKYCSKIQIKYFKDWYENKKLSMF